MPKDQKFTLVVQKMNVRPHEWQPHAEHQVTGRITPKQIILVDSIYRGKKFYRETGREITSLQQRGGWFRYSLKPPNS